MQLNTKVRYGLRTMIEIGLCKGTQSIFQKDIALNQQLSDKYLDVIISSLKTAGLIINASGKKSGYRLNLSPSKITVLDIFRAFEPGPQIIAASCNPCMFNHTVKCPSHKYWDGLNDLMIQYMKKAKLSELIEHYKIINPGKKLTKKKSLTSQKKQ